MFSGRSFFIIPDGPSAQRSYAAFAEGLRDRRKWGVGWLTVSGRCHAAVSRLLENVLALDVLHDLARLRPVTGGSFTTTRLDAGETGLAGKLIDSASVNVRWSDYHDDTAGKFAALIQEKLKQLALEQNVNLQPISDSPTAAPSRLRKRTSAKSA